MLNERKNLLLMSQKAKLYASPLNPPQQQRNNVMGKAVVFSAEVTAATTSQLNQSKKQLLLTGDLVSNGLSLDSGGSSLQVLPAINQNKTNTNAASNITQLQ